MKQILLFFLLCALGLNLYSKEDKSKLLLRIWDDSEFMVVFDKKEYKTPSSKFRLNKVNPGKHKIKITKRIIGPMGYSEDEVLYKGIIDIPASSKVVAKINRFNELIIVSVKSLLKDEQVIEREKREDVLSIVDFKKLINEMEGLKYESDRLALAKNTIGEQQIRTGQVHDIINLFGFESTRIEFAIYIYPSVINKKSFSKINEVFIKSNSIAEVEKYIAEYHKKMDE